MDEIATEISNTIRQLGKAKGDPFEILIVNGLRAKGVPEDRARTAARECSNRIWRNGMVSGAAAVVLVSATHANLAGAAAGGSIAALGGMVTFLLSDACKEARQLSESEVLSAVDGLLGGK